MKLDRNAEALLYTERGQEWLAQFSETDQEVARKIVASLTLVSHSEFERVVQKSLESISAEYEHPVGFFAVRELDPIKSYFEQFTDPDSGKISALVSGTDHGSEARIAATIRNYCKTDPNHLLNHPSLDQMREARCRTVVLVDDFIGSGKRISEFMNSLWIDTTFISWLSLHYINIVVVAFSGTGGGIKRVVQHKAKPNLVIERDCPNFIDMPWGQSLRDSAMDVCKKYAGRTSKKRFWGGFGGALTALVFEHGCPNNAPAILWAPKTPKKSWNPLFPNRVIMSGEKTVFPPEIGRGDALVTLLDVGQKRLAGSGQLLRRGENGELILLMLALIAKGQRRQSALSFATGLNRKACAQIMQRCVKWSFLTPSFRLTERGRAELTAAKKVGKVYAGFLERGSANYYPNQLRKASRG
ncbi:phosphoribosyltransferase-like protein [Vreelandella zhaodongensis]|uniref:phosphoribosyltransferase-like protein n=1 Tax=Vreelandella zhaodongensis TaxID=1176240 RepID=UPI003EBE282F